MFNIGCHLGCHLDFHFNTDLPSSVNAPLNYKLAPGLHRVDEGPAGSHKQSMILIPCVQADTRQTDRNVQVVRELVDGQSCHVGKCLLLPSTPTSRRYKLHMDPWSTKTLRSHELWTQTATVGLFSRLWSPSCLFLWCCSRQGSSSSSTAETFGAP
jgi:hypothetical protein